MFKPLSIVIAVVMGIIFLGDNLYLGSIHSWGLHLKGPLFVAMFKPLSIVIAVVMGVIFLGDNLYLGSVVVAAVISIGFYID
ncbi:hypothetical protein CTI12_AA230800 [Artemisia annua]|uniref:WAT1-related protein n=1 Tax=Artemisia annua TaxID=35608 RepID=A0A2U1M5F4_ARTAN|nr:hypothetical protein CTI12_AA230800 [Artemisia annua]